MAQGSDLSRTRHRKPHLPEKVCVVCGRPFTWRKKWERDWETIQTCSDRCKGRRRQAAREVGT